MLTAVGTQAVGRRVPRWYVLQVTRGRERAMAERLSRVLPAGVLEEPVFLPAFETEMKVRGAWVRTTKPLLEGYLVAVSAEPERLRRAVARMVEFTQVLATDAGPAPLSREEVELFGGAGQPGARVLPMSRAYKLADGRVVITEGPLRGRERLIERIDRRKSTAYLRVEVAGRPVEARAGLAVLNAPEGFDDSGLDGIAGRNCKPASLAAAGMVA